MLKILSTIQPEVFAQAGVVIVFLYFLYNQRQKEKEWNKMLTNHLEHEQDSRDKLTKALEKLTNKIDQLK